jgi:hypothetical protein
MTRNACRELVGSVHEQRATPVLELELPPLDPRKRLERATRRRAAA